MATIMTDTEIFSMCYLRLTRCGMTKCSVCHPLIVTIVVASQWSVPLQFCRNDMEPRIPLLVGQGGGVGDSGNYGDFQHYCLHYTIVSQYTIVSGL
jgi:hypothetical protein